MSEIVIKRDWGEINRAGIARFLNSRFYGRWPRIIILGVALMVLVAGILAAEFLLPRRHVPPNWTVAFAPLYFAVVAAVLLNARWRRRLYRALNDAPIRRENLPVRLSRQGISDTGMAPETAMPWRFVTGVVEYRDMVLLLLSPTEYIPLPDSGLPDGLGRAGLLEQIGKWREADEGE